MDERNPKTLYQIFAVLIGICVIALFAGGFGLFPGDIGGIISISAGLFILISIFWLVVITSRARAARRGDPTDPEAPFDHK